MTEWYQILGSGVFLTGSAFALRELLIAIVALWSMGTKQKFRRDHALRLLKLLKVQIRRPPIEPPVQPTEVLPQQNPPPPSGSGVV